MAGIKNESSYHLMVPLFCLHKNCACLPNMTVVLLGILSKYSSSYSIKIDFSIKINQKFFSNLVQDNLLNNFHIELDLRYNLYF